MFRRADEMAGIHAILHYCLGVRRTVAVTAVILVVSACSASTPVPTPAPVRPQIRVVRETVTVKDPELETRLGRVELRLLEKEAQVEELQSRLDETRNEVVRTMAKLRTVASRAEAASGIAEAEVALQSLRANSGQQQSPAVAQVTRLMRQSAAEFSRQNYGGALYLADQAKTLAADSQRGLVAARGGWSRSGETAFALPVRLTALTRGNVRAGPGTNFAVAFEAQQGTALTGYAYVDEWIRVTDNAGRSGWIFRTLVSRR
jgi:uncharacterized coiled-coil protein SlyX